MAAFINTNVSSLNAQRNLNASQGALQTSLQRLSSGLRINSAKDDAAGLAIADRFSTQIRGLNQAVRNANDGISLSQTAEGALGEIGNNLQRIRELAVQAANSTNSASDRAAINQEVQQRLAEIDRTSSQTSFNGQKILDGSFGSANFQVGANAGETIGLNLQTSMRNTAIGKIATTESTVLGSTATNGHIDVTSTNLLYGTAGSAATAGQIDIAASTFNFAAATPYQAGTSSPQAVTNVNHDFSLGTTQVDANSVYGGGTVSTFDYSAGGLAQFDVNIAGSTTATVGITLNQNYANGAAVAQAIQDQIQATAGNEDVTVTFAAGSYTFTNVGKAGAGNAITITGTDANAEVATQDFSAETVNNGTVGVASSAATMTIDGVNITLDQNNADRAAVAAELQTKMQASALGAGYTAAVVGNDIVITNATGGTNTNAVAITNVDANAAAAGFSNSTGVAGTAAAAGNPASLTIDGTVVNLNADYLSYDGLASAIQTQLGGGFTVTNNSGTINVARNTTGAGSTSVDITAADANAQAAFGIGATDSGTAGANAVPTTNATFYVDGNAVTLNQNYADQNAVASAIGSQLAAAGYTAANNAGVITIQKTGSLTAVNITGADTNATAGGFGFASGTAGVAGGSVTLAAGEFTIASGTGDAVDMAGTYTDTQALAEAINKNVNNVYAKVDAGKLVLSSSSDMTLGGTQATGSLGFAGTSVTASTGSLAQSNTLTVDAALSTLQRVDSALNSVNSLRSTFGAIQNRFESVIANLSSTSENLSAARSRIQDADFAAETAILTRGQILQQAGTAMLAQANSLPNGVLALLRG